MMRNCKLTRGGCSNGKTPSTFNPKIVGSSRLGSKKKRELLGRVEKREGNCKLITGTESRNCVNLKRIFLLAGCALRKVFLAAQNKFLIPLS